jgi:TRAP-type C4-dicarboxylate transport system permease small subunit
VACLIEFAKGINFVRELLLFLIYVYCCLRAVKSMKNVLSIYVVFVCPWFQHLRTFCFLEDIFLGILRCWPYRQGIRVSLLFFLLGEYGQGKWQTSNIDRIVNMTYNIEPIQMTK